MDGKNETFYLESRIRIVVEMGNVRIEQRRKSVD